MFCVLFDSIVCHDIDESDKAVTGLEDRWNEVSAQFPSFRDRR